MTVKELKSIIRDWPEVNYLGEDTEVWIEVDNCGRSNICSGYLPLNFRTDSDGNESSDILLEVRTGRNKE